MMKVTSKVKKTLSVLLVATMIIAAVPQNTLMVSAEELNEETVSQIMGTVDAEAEDAVSEAEDTEKDAEGSECEEDSVKEDGNEEEKTDEEESAVQDIVEDEVGGTDEKPEGSETEAGEEDANPTEESGTQTVADEIHRKVADVESMEADDQEIRKIMLKLMGEHAVFWNEDGTEQISQIELTADLKAYVTIQVAAESDNYTIKKLTSGVTGIRVVANGSGDKGAKYRLQYSKIAEDCNEVTITAEMVEVSNNTLTVSMTDNADKISGLTIMQNGEIVQQNEDGSYTVSNQYRVVVSASIGEGYLPYIINATASTKTVIPADDMEIQNGTFTYSTDKFFEDHSIIISAKEAARVTLHLEGGVELNMLKVANDYLSMGNVDIQDGTVIQVYRNEDLLLAAASSNLGTVQIAGTKDFADNSLWTLAKDQYDTYEGYENYWDYSIFCQNITSDCDVYVRVKPLEIPVVYPEGVSVSFGQDEGYSVSSDGKILYLSQETNVQFGITNNTGKELSVIKKYKDSELDENEQPIIWTEAIEPIDSEAANKEYQVYLDSNVLGIEITAMPKISFQYSHAIVWCMTDEYNADFCIEEDVYRSKGSMLRFRVDPEEGYMVSYVSLTGREEDALTPAGSDNTYYEMEVSDDTTIYIRMMPQPKTFSLVNQSENISASIVTDNKVKYVEESGCYQVYYGAEQVVLTLRLSREVTSIPKVYCLSTESGMQDISFSDSKVEESEVIYSYLISEDELPDVSEIYIADGTKEEGILSVSYDESGITSVQVTDTKGNVMSPESVVTNMTQDTYTVKQGQTYHVTIKAQTGYYVGKVETSREGQNCVATYQRSSCTLEVAIAGDETCVGISPYAQRKAVVTLADTSEEQDAVKTSQTYSDYNLQDGLYRVAVTEADETKMISRADVKDNSGGAASYGSGDTSWEYIYLAVGNENQFKDEEDGIPVVNLGTQKKNVKLTLEDGSTYELRTNYRAELTSITLTFVPIVDKGSTEYGTLERPVDTTRHIIVKAVKNGNVRDRINLDRLKYTIECDTYTNAQGKTVPCVTGEWYRRRADSTSLTFRVITGDVAGKTATVKFYTTDPGSPLATFKVLTTDTTVKTLQETAPTVKITGTDDVSATINIKGMQDVSGACYAGRQYYMITAVPTSAEYPNTIAPSKTWYVARTFPDYPEDATDAQIAKLDKAYSQDVKIKLNEAESGYGVACDFDVKVSLIQTKAGVDCEDLQNGSEAYYPGRVIPLAISTKAPVYETKVSLKKKNSTVYSGQKNVLLATAGFSKTTSCVTVSAADVTACEEEKKIVLSVSDDGQIYADVPSEVLLGNHTIEVIPTAGGKQMYQQPTIMTVKVVKGIETLEVIPDSYELYKAGNKAATLNTTVKYNEKEEAPKTKKVRYEIVGAEGEEITEGDALYGLIKISANGKVTVDKKLVTEDIDVQFCIKATAADYAGNHTFAVSAPIQITSDPCEIGVIKILKWNQEQYCYEVIGTDKSSLSTDQLDGAVLAAFANDNDTREEYYKYELSSEQIPITNYGVKSSNKAITLSTEGDLIRIGCEKVAKNVKLTATTRDGGKKSKTITVTSTYYQPEDMVLAFSYADGVSLADPGTETVVFEGTSNTKIKLSVLESTEDGNVSFPGLVNYSVTIGKGGKLISSNILKGEYSLLVTGDQTTITLTNKALSKTDSAYKKIYTVKNSLAQNVKTVGPTVKVMGNLKSETEAEQKLIITASLPKKNNSYSMDETYVLVAPDEISAAKAQTQYDDVVAACQSIGQCVPVEVVEKNGVYTIDLDFAGRRLAAGSYKLQFTFGKMQDAQFIPDSKPATVTLKVTKPKVNKGSLKPTTSYVVKKNADGTYANAEIKLAYSGKSIQQFAFEELYDCNNKGYENHFLDYFVFDRNTQTIKLKNNLSENEIAYITGSKGKNDRVAYIEYSAKVGDDGYGNPFIQRKVVKITVNFK